MTVLEVLKLSTDYLARHGSESSRLDAEVLLAHALDVRRLDLYLQFDRTLGETELSAYRSLVARRGKGEPVAYLVGHKEFMGLDFEVTPDVLVPNPDTEVLVQRAVAIARDAGRWMRVADVGTGSGCIAVAVAHYAPNTEVFATDISSPALTVAARNVARHHLVDRVHVVHSDLMSGLEGEFDLVCANLPYVGAETRLPAEVTAQPASALYAEERGAAMVRRLLAEAPPRLKPGARVLAEIDPVIAEEVGVMASSRFAGHHIHRDLSGHERVLEAWS